MAPMTRQPAEAMRIDSGRAVTRGNQTLDLKSEVPAAAESLQACPTLCDPTEGSPPGSSIPGILQARILESAAISFSKGILS